MLIKPLDWKIKDDLKRHIQSKRGPIMISIYVQSTILQMDNREIQTHRIEIAYPLTNRNSCDFNAGPDDSHFIDRVPVELHKPFIV